MSRLSDAKRWAGLVTGALCLRGNIVAQVGRALVDRRQHSDARANDGGGQNDPVKSDGPVRVVAKVLDKIKHEISSFCLLRSYGKISNSIVLSNKKDH